VPITILGDSAPEAVETFLVTLSNASSNATIGTAQAAVHIVPALAAPSVSVSDVALPEGDAGATTDFVFTVSLSGPSSEPAVVSFATADETATVADNDYAATSGTLTFAPGETSRSVTVHVSGDNTSEPNETFLLNVNALAGATGSPTGRATIVDDDG